LRQRHQLCITAATATVGFAAVTISFAGAAAATLSFAGAIALFNLIFKNPKFLT